MKKNKSNELANKNYNQRKIEKDILPIPNLKNYINHINDDNSFPKKKYSKYSVQNLTLNNNYSQDIKDINEKNILLLTEKVKEQEKNIVYLNSRLKNYDITMNEITKLNIELNKLNEIIRKKNKTIQEFRDISDLSKLKLEELIKNNNELIQKINLLREENEKLDKKYNDINDELNEVKNENNELKNKIKEKEKEINILKQNLEIKNKSIVDKKLYLNYDKKNNNVTYNITNTENKGKDNEKYDINYYKINNRLRGYPSMNGKILQERRNMPLNMKRNIGSGNIRKNTYLYNKDYLIRTEPSSKILDNYDSLNKLYGDGVKNRYNYLNINGKDIRSFNNNNY
jgi:predicted nuclease with TOPRIM domain